MADEKVCDCLNNESQIDSVLDEESTIESLLSEDTELSSDLGAVLEVVKRYEGGTTNDIIVDVDNEKNLITATLQKMWFSSFQEFPEVGSKNLIYADKGTGSLYTYNIDSGSYEKLVDSAYLRSISIAGETVEPDENKNADIPKATSGAFGVVKVDGTLTDEGENPVQGKVVKEYIDEGDSAIYEEINGLSGEIGATNGRLSAVEATLEETINRVSDTENKVKIIGERLSDTVDEVSDIGNKVASTETKISELEQSTTNAFAEINNNINNINTELDDKASLTEENTFTGKQNFESEVLFDGVAEHSKDVKLTDSQLVIMDTTSGFTTKVSADKITKDENIEISLPDKSGTLLTNNDNVAYRNEIPDVSEFITRAVNDLINYYTKSEVDTTVKGLQAQISAIPKFAISVVNELPSTNISETTIYLLKTSTTETGNLYTEYIYINNSWESLGTQTLDLSEYAKESWVEEKIANFLTASQVSVLITSALQEYSKTAEFSEIAFSGNLSDGNQDSTHRLVSDSEKATWNSKQNTLTFDEVPTANSDNPVKSKGIKAELEKKANTTDIPTVPTKVSSFENDSNYATKDYVDENGGKIDTISVNSVVQTITNKNVNIEVPTKVSQLENDSNYLTEYMENDPTVPDWAKQPTKPTYDYSEIENTPIIPTGVKLYEETGTNTDGAMTQKATTDALGEKITKNMFDTYVGTVDACSDTDGNFGQCANIYKTDGTLYAGRKFTFNKDDFKQEGTDDNKKYSLADDVVRTDDLNTAISGVETELATKVENVEGKGLSTNDFTTVEKTKLAGLSNYDDTEVKGLISSETETRQNAVDTLQGEIDSSNENISDLYNVVDKNVVTDATVAETTSQANITLTKTNISSGATATKTISIPSATGSQAGLLSAEDQTIAGVKTFTAPEFIRETEQVTTKFKTSNGGALSIGKEGKNSGTMLKFEQTEGTTRLRFRGSNAAGAMIWEQPEQGAQLYFDLGEQGVDYKRILMPSSAGTLALTSQIPTNYVTTNTEQTVTGKKTFSSDVTIGGNLNVTGTTTTVDSTTLQVKDKLIEVAHGNTTSLTTPAGLVAPKYNGTQDGALVFDNTGTAYVGDVTLNNNGDIDVANSDLQALATREDLTDGNLVQWDSSKEALVDSETSISDLNANINSKQTQLSTTQLNAVNSGITSAKVSTYDGYNSAINAKYTKPSTGIPKTDLASDVQSSLGKADTALQSHQDISGKLTGTKFGSASFDTYIPYTETTSNTAPKYLLSFVNDNGQNGLTYTPTANAVKQATDLKYFSAHASDSQKKPSECLTNGFYYVSSTVNSLTEADGNPFLQYHTSNYDFRILTTAHSDNWLQQVATDFRTEHIYVRRRESGTWKPWVKIVETADIPTYSNATTSTAGLMSATDKSKLDGVETGAEKNVQSDWEQTDTTADDYIKNKPVIPDEAVLYDGTGEHTDGAMTQKAVTDELEKKVTLDTAQTVTGEKNFTSPVTATEFVENGASLEDKYATNETIQFDGSLSGTLTDEQFSKLFYPEKGYRIALTIGSDREVILTYQSYFPVAGSGNYVSYVGTYYTGYDYNPDCRYYRLLIYPNKDYVVKYTRNTYPVGSIYLSVNATSPASRFGGAWEELPSGNALWTTSTTNEDAGKTIDAGLPDIYGGLSLNKMLRYGTAPGNFTPSGAFDGTNTTDEKAAGGGSSHSRNTMNITFYASRVSSIYGNSTTVQPPAYKIYAWKRIS